MLGEFCVCSTNKVPGGSLYVLTCNIYEHTYRKWSFCNVCRWVHLKKSPFLATNIQKTVKQGPVKENKFNTVLCISVNQLSGQRNHSLTQRHFVHNITNNTSLHTSSTPKKKTTPWSPPAAGFQRLQINRWVRSLGVVQWRTISATRQCTF